MADEGDCMEMSHLIKAQLLEHAIFQISVAFIFFLVLRLCPKSSF